MLLSFRGRADGGCRGIAVLALCSVVAAACATTPPPAPPPPPAQAPKIPATPMQEAGVTTLQPALDAIAKAEAAVAATPNDVAAWVHFSLLLKQANRTQEAARAAWHAVDLESTFATWSNLGNVLAQGDVFMTMGGAMGAFQAFKMAARDAKAKSPGSVESAARNFLNLAHRDLQMGHDEQALELIKEAEVLAPTLPIVHYHRALAFALGGQASEAKAAAQQTLDLIAKHAPNQTPNDPEMAKLQPLAAGIVAGNSVTRPSMQQTGETLPERFWERPPARGQAMALALDAASDRYLPLVPGIAMRLQVPTNWTHQMKATDQAVHLRMASPVGERAFLLQITLFPVVRENFTLKAAAIAGRNGAQAPNSTVGPLLPLERKDGLAFWFYAVETPTETAASKRPQYTHLVQVFAYAKPFVWSATLLSQRDDNAVKDAVLQMARSFDVFRLQPTNNQLGRQ